LATFSDHRSDSIEEARDLALLPAPERSRAVEIIESAPSVELGPRKSSAAFLYLDRLPPSPIHDRLLPGLWCDVG